MKGNTPTPEKIMQALASVCDPEIPVLSIIDLGIVRDVKIKNNIPEISITPTYTGCPAMKVIEDEIREAIRKEGLEDVIVKTVLAPPWTTDWIGTEAKEKLKAYGIAPPEKSSPDKSTLFGSPKAVACPRCASSDTEMISQFGSTACKALYRCRTCREPFDYFKCL